MQKTLFIPVFLLFFAGAFSQGIDPHINLGEGVVTVLQYAFPPPPERPAREKIEPQAMVHSSSDLSYTYYIKKNKVLLSPQRDENAAKPLSGDTTTLDNGVGLATFLTAKYVHPVYLIDCVKRTACYLSNSTHRIVEKNLEETSTELFYRNVNIASPQAASIVSLSDSSETLIAGKKCYKGLARFSDGNIFPPGVRNKTVRHSG